MTIKTMTPQLTDYHLGHDEKNDPILCPHCQRTASNGIKCKGICVADSNY